jgi:hypothetical protein
LLVQNLDETLVFKDLPQDTSLDDQEVAQKTQEEPVEQIFVNQSSKLLSLSPMVAEVTEPV